MRSLGFRTAGPSCLVLLLGACAGGAPAPVANPGAAAPAADSSADPAAAAPVGEKADYRNTIRWATASEVDNFGFDIFRATSPDGPFETVNDEVIPGRGTTEEPTSYEFVDTSIDPYTEYYYYIESISLSGVRERFTPVSKARAKLPREAEGDSQ